MRIAKPLLLVSTPIGVVAGIYEGYRLAGGLVFLMVMLLGVIGVAAFSVVRTIRRERRDEEAAERAAGGAAAPRAGQGPGREPPV
jgi:uncharacterized membrane protein